MAPVGRLVAMKVIGESASLALIGNCRVVPACTVLSPIGAKTGELAGAGDGPIGVGDGVIGVGDEVIGVGDGVIGAGDGVIGVGDRIGAGVGVLGTFVTVIVIVSELSVLVTVTPIWLPSAVDVVETVPLKAHPLCAETRQTEMISTLRVLFIFSPVFMDKVDPLNNTESRKNFANQSRHFAPSDRFGAWAGSQPSRRNPHTASFPAPKVIASFVPR